MLFSLKIGAGVMIEENRELGPEMTAEGWKLTGGEWLIWCHEPTHRVVTVEDWRWDQCRRIPAYPREPSAPDAEGFVVGCFVWDDLGNPTSDGDCVWVESYGLAIKIAREARSNVLRGMRKLVRETQLTFDDLLERNAS